MRLNGSPAKASTTLVTGDTVTVRMSGFERTLEVRRLLAKRVGAEVASHCFTDHTPPRRRHRRWASPTGPWRGASHQEGPPRDGTAQGPGSLVRVLFARRAIRIGTVNNIVLASVRQPGGDTVSDLHIVDGVVTRISSGGGIPDGARVVSLDGRYVIPGLWDEHVHMTQWALHSNRPDLSAAASAREAAAAVGLYVHDADPSVTIVGVGFRDALWPDVPTLDMLDAATGNQPTALISHDLHCVWLNSAAARRYGVEVDDGGLLREEPAFALTRELGKLPDSVVDGWVRDAARSATARASWGSLILR
ncbi:amidohydrolase 3 [Arthrobacter sp. Hiyo4]|nr:amidohydrolase 3 [Arthrobacter sp. Hiyo4]